MLTTHCSRPQLPSRSGPTRGSVLLAVLPLCLLGSACVEQPKPDCISSTAAYAVKLLEQRRSESMPGACDEFGPAAFNQDPEVGIVPYFARNARGQPDYDRGSLAIQTAELGALYDEALARGADNLATDGALYSFGAFTQAEPDGAGLCHVPELSSTRLVLPDIAAVDDDAATADVDESAAALPAVDATLEWSNVEVYVSAASLGTQVAADLSDTRQTASGQTCTIEYRALALAPAVPCMAVDPDSGAPLQNEDGSFQLDPAACDPEADPAAGRAVGSGISPNTAFVCDPVSAFCVLASDRVPSLR